jgi:DNA modification methylase
VQTVVTSPPYWGLRKYAGEQEITEWGSALGLEPTPDLYVAHMVDVFREVRRVLRPDGTLWLNLGDSYAGGQGAAGGSSARSTLVGTHHDNRARFDTVRDFGALKQKDLVGIPWRVAFALQADGWYLRSDIIWAKPNPMPESVTDRPTKAHEYLFLLTKSPRYYYDADAIREEQAEQSLRAYERARENPHDPAAWKQNEAIAHLGDSKTASPNAAWSDPEKLDRLLERGRNARTVWTVATQPYPGAHFATFPEKLIDPCILAGSARGDLVLDPFNGSGTTGRVAIRHGREYVGLDISHEYLHEQATQRVDKIQHTMGI